MRIIRDCHQRTCLALVVVALTCTTASTGASPVGSETTEQEQLPLQSQSKDQQEIFSLRASHIFHHDNVRLPDPQPADNPQEQSPPATILDRSLIIDKVALEDLAHDGADPTAREYVFHPPGHEANVNDYPFFAHWSHAMCGASVIHDDILLTAGHCGRKAGEPHWRKTVRLLSKFRESQGITRTIAGLTVHPDNYQPKQLYDFQLIKLSESVLVDVDGNPTGVEIVATNKDRNNPAAGDPIQAAGFGTVTPDGSTGNSHVLMDVTLQAFAIDHCKKQYGSVIDSDVMVCIGTLDGSQDTCQGDSGGPMIGVDGSQVGVVSWGEGCAEADHTGLASRVSAVTDWIEAGICALSATPPASCGADKTISYNHRLPPSDGETKENIFDLRVTVSHDSAPEETAWSLTHVDSHTLLYFQDFESVPTPFVDISHVVHRLTAGTYFFAISDQKKDGICCNFGEGSIAITHHETNEVLWQHAGDFTDFVSVTLQLDSSGSLVSAKEAVTWINPSVETSDSNHAKYDGKVGVAEEETST